MHTKDAKSEVLYFKPASIGRAAGARCGACWKFIPGDKKCLEVLGEIAAGGVCGLYVNGMPHFDKVDADLRAWKINQVSKAEAGYTDAGDTHCQNCEHMARPRDAYSPCEEVEGMVEPGACCNEHERR